MNIQETALYREILLIGQNGVKTTAYQWQALIHSGGKTVKPLFVNEVNTDRNYLTRFCDVKSVVISILEGDYYHDIAPNKSNLEITLRKIPLTGGDNPVVDYNAVVKEFRYKAVLYDGRNPTLEGNNPLAANQEKANRASFREVRFQLIYPLIEYLRTETLGTAFRGMTGINVIRAALTHYSQLFKSDANSAVKGATILGTPTRQARDHILIDHMTPLMEMPRRVEERCGGIFATGFEWYLQGQHWYLYSPYDLKAYNTSPKSLTIINVPKDRYPAPEASYRVTATQVVIMSTGEVKHNDFSEEMQLNMGNGIAFIDANKVFEDFGTVDGNKLTIDSALHVNQFTLDPRSSGLNVVRQSAVKITSNYQREYSKMAIRSGAFVQLVWENGDADLLYPGMATRLLYMKNNEAVEVYGTVVGVNELSLPNSKNIGQRRFTNQIAITLFIDRRSP